MKRRTPILVAPPRAGDPSQAIDAAFFRRHPETREYTRMYVAGESPEPMPPGTMVRVLRIGAQRVRGFVPPAAESES